MTGREKTIAIPGGTGSIQVLMTENPSGFDAFRLADRDNDPVIVTIPDFVKTGWSYVPGHIRPHRCPICNGNGRSVRGYAPKTGGTCFRFETMR